MWLEQTAAPQSNALGLDEAKRQLRILGSSDDTEVEELVQQAVQYVDGRGGLLNRALITQSWEYRIHQFPLAGGPIYLPLPPLRSVESVTYIDTSGSEQTLATSEYVVETQTRVGLIREAYNKTWPTARAEPFAVRISFTAGYGASASDVPAPIRAAIKLVMTHFYDNRGAVDPEALRAAIQHVAGAYIVDGP